MKKIEFLGKEVALIVCVVFVLPAFAFAAENNVVSIEGKVMSLDMTKKILLFSSRRID